MSKSLRIAISGFSGTGKTSLAIALAERLELPIIKENMIDLAKIHGQYLALIDSGHFISKGSETTPFAKKTIDAFTAWDRQRTNEYRKNDGFVADRWEADLLNMWLVRFGTSSETVDSITSSMMKNFQEKSKLFNLIVVTPLIAPFTRDQNENNIGRPFNLTSHILNMSITLSLIQNFASVPLFCLPNAALSVAERVDLIVSHLDAVAAGKS